MGHQRLQINLPLGNEGDCKGIIAGLRKDVWIGELLVNAKATHSVSEGALDGDLLYQRQGHRYQDVWSSHAKLIQS